MHLKFDREYPSNNESKNSFTYPFSDPSAKTPSGKLPPFLQKTKVNLYIPKFNNELPDYNSCPIPLSDEQLPLADLKFMCINSVAENSNIAASPSKDPKGNFQNLKDGFANAIEDLRGDGDEDDIFSQKRRLRQKKMHKQILKLLDSKSINIFLFFITIYALFADDFRILVLPKSSDSVMDVITIVCIIAFCVEMVLGYISKPNYRCSFFFWLDLIATLSMILDLSFISSEVFSAQANTTQIARAGRVSRIGTRAGRVVKIFRLVRIVKLWKSMKKADKFLKSSKFKEQFESINELMKSLTKFEKKDEETHQRRKSSVQSFLTGRKGKTSFDDKRDSVKYSSNAVVHSSDRIDKSDKQHQIRKSRTSITVNKHGRTQSLFEMKIQKSDEEEEERTTKESRVGKLLSELTTKRVIVITLVSMLVVPLLQTDSWFEKNLGYIYDFTLLESFYNSNLAGTHAERLVDEFIERYDGQKTPVLYFIDPEGETLYGSKSDTDDLRTTEFELLESSKFDEMESAVNTVYFAKAQAGINMGRTVFICLVLALGALFFSKDANDLVLRPLERMIAKINRIALSPLSAKREALREHEDKNQMETTVLENAITKLGTLLALGFGDAGASIIATNILQSGDVNPMSSGQKIVAVFGFCDIRNFTDATEVLQQDVMLFVNQIAAIVHDKVDKYGGAANKNIGDAFLLVWKFQDDDVEETDEDLRLKKTETSSGICDLSLFTFVKIMVKIEQDPKIRAYRKNAGLNKRLKNYKVRMGFGLHVGWAIEGAIGSHFKIDASYLSPNVNMASRLEAATKQYGVPILISSDMFEYMSDGVQQYCRQIDTVTVKGSEIPIGLYTIDLFKIELDEKSSSNRSKKMRILRHELKKNKILEMISEGKIATNQMFETDEEIQYLLQLCKNKLFRGLWDEGFQFYTEGSWQSAFNSFQRLLANFPDDGPSITLIEFMKSYDYQSPTDWRGYRPIEKV